MNKSIISFITFILFSILTAKGQVTIGSGTPPNYFSILEIDATNTKGGLRLPQLLNTERDAISVNGNITTAPGLVIYNKTDNTLEYWNGTAWVKALELEPFQVSGSTTKASQNTENIYQMGNVGVGINVPTNKLHVVAASNPLRIEGLTSGVTADSLLSIDATGLVKQRSVYSLRQDIIKYPDPVNQIFPGMIRFNATTKQLEYYDGTTWQAIAANTSGGKNEGVVRITGGIGGSVPTFTFTNPDLGNYKNVNYALPLTLVAYWPENVTSPTDADIVGTNGGNTTYRENPIIGQVHTWRVVMTYSSKNNGSVAFITVRLRNPIPPSTFVLQQTAICPNGTTTGTITVNFTTIADGLSIPPPVGNGNGYLIDYTSDTPLTITVNNVTRISAYKD